MLQAPASHWRFRLDGVSRSAEAQSPLYRTIQKKSRVQSGESRVQSGECIVQSVESREQRPARFRRFPRPQLCIPHSQLCTLDFPEQPTLPRGSVARYSVPCERRPCFGSVARSVADSACPGADARSLAARPALEPAPLSAAQLRPPDRQIDHGRRRRPRTAACGAWIPGARGRPVRTAEPRAVSQDLARLSRAWAADPVDQVESERTGAGDWRPSGRELTLAGADEEDDHASFSGVDLLILDEASRVPDDLYRSVRPMLAVSRGRLLALSTPFGQRGWFYEEWIGAGPWQRIHIPWSRSTPLRIGRRTSSPGRDARLSGLRRLGRSGIQRPLHGHGGARVS